MIDAPTIERLLALPVEDRLTLVEALWDSLAAEPQSVPVPEWHKEILAEHIAEHDGDDGPGERWETVRRRIEGGA